MEKINIWVLLAISIIVTLVYYIFRNVFSKKHVLAASDYYLFNAVSSVFTMIAFIPQILGEPPASAYTLLLGALFGAVTAGAAIFTLSALKIGPMSYTTLIITLSCVIPALSGWAFWNETISFGQWAGIVLMAASFVLLTEKADKQSGQKNINGRWIAFCMGAFVLSGLIGVLQKIHQSSVHRGELGGFLLSAFAVSAAASFAAWLILRRGERTRGQQGAGMSRAVFGIAALCGLCIAGGNLFNLYLAGVMDSAVFFPVVNGGGLLLSVAAAIILFKERLPLRRTIGLVVGMAAILLVGGIIN